MIFIYSLKSCYESGITGKFYSLLKFIAKIDGKSRKDADEFAASNLFHGDSIKLDAFLRGPLLTLVALYPIIIIVIFSEIFLKKLFND